MNKICIILVIILLCASISWVPGTVTALKGDDIPPVWQNQGQNKSVIKPGESILLYAQGKDDVALDWAWLATNENGDWTGYAPEWWNYYKKLYISNPYEDYQIPLTVFKENGHDNAENGIIDCEGHCNTDFSDLRFIASDRATLLPYWVEKTGIENGDHFANIWVKTSDEATIYMYYGNLAADPVSNGTETFLFFDDFTSDTTGEWSIHDEPPLHIESHRWRMRPDYDTAHRRIRFQMEMTSYKYDDNDGVQCLFGAANQDQYDPHDFIGFYLNTNGEGSADSIHPGIMLKSVSDDTISDTGWETSDIVEDEIYIFELRLDPDDTLSGDIWDLYGNLIYSNTIVTNLPTSLSYHTFLQYHWGGVYTWSHNPDTNRGVLFTKRGTFTDISHMRNQFDWWFVAKYDSSEPSWNAFENEVSESIAMADTTTYNSPMDIDEVADEWVWTNFTWQNSDISTGTEVSWKIYYMDASGNIANTGIMSFTITESDIIYVDDSNTEGPWLGTQEHPYQHIQDGVENAEPDSTVYVYSGIYSENVEINKRITLQGENKNTTIIDADGSGSAIEITANYVNIRGFTSQNSGPSMPEPIPPSAAIRLCADHCTIAENIITNNDYGMVIHDGEHNYILNNMITNNEYKGLYLVCSSHNIITGNTMSQNNEVGLEVYCNIIPGTSGDNHIYHNNFMDNTENALDGGLTEFDNHWDNGYPSGGNYWDDYTGSDDDGDGIGDTPYDIPGGDNNDFYPLMNPWTGVPPEENFPPNQPERPSGPSSGNTGVEHTYTTTTTDPDEDDVYYLWDWGDGTDSGWLGPYDSGKTVSCSHSWANDGLYNIKVKAKDIYDIESDWSPSRTLTITHPLPKLTVSTSPNVIESESFTVTVKHKDTEAAIPDTNVTFNEEIKQTNNNGQVTFTAPEVNQDTIYIIIANREGYQFNTTTITVLNKRERNGWIGGIIYNESGSPIEDASISVIVSDDTTIKKFTDNQGIYVILVPSGTYTLTANAEGYEPSTIHNVIVYENKLTEANFNLIEITVYEPESPDDIQQLINKAIKDGKILGEISFEKEGYSVIKYSTDITFTPNVDSKNKKISLIFDTEIDLGKTIIITINESLFSIENIKVEFDGKEIKEAESLQKILDSDSDIAEYWITNNMVLVSTPYLSEHTITIYQVIETISLIVAIILYVAICIVGASAFIYPFFAWPARLRKGGKL